MKKLISGQSKFKAALELEKGEHTINEICSKYNVKRTAIYRWHKELLERGAELYSQKQVSEQTSDANIPMLQRKIGELTMQIDFLKKALGQ
jgi:transposase